MHMMLACTGMVSEDGEFYISSSSRPFQFPGGASDMLTSNGSQFFPGQLYLMGTECKQGDITVDFVTPDNGIIDITAPDKLSALETGVDSYNDEVDTSASSISGFAVILDNQLASHKSDSIKKLFGKMKLIVLSLGRMKYLVSCHPYLWMLDRRYPWSARSCRNYLLQTFWS
jgi:hypothetical protein